MSYLLDASAVYPLVLRLRERLLDHAEEFFVLDLTVYEVGNSLLKEFKMGRVKDLEAAAGLFEEIFSFITVLRPQVKVHEVVELAAGENLTFYDASYLYTARAYKAKLVTEDKELLKFPESIGVEQLLSELGIPSS